MAEHQVVARRRMSKILDHVAGNDEVPRPSPHLLPMNCSSTLNSMVRQCDNRLLFARQGSTSQGCFMHQVSITQNFGPGDSSQQNLPHNCSCSGNGYSYQHAGEPMFSRQAQTDSTLFAMRDDQSMKQDLTLSSTEAPKFARPCSGESEKKQLLCNRTRQASTYCGMEWSPRMDVAESGSNYFVTIELPGVSIIDIRVEVDDEKLTVMGKRATQWWRVTNGSESLNPTFYRREILDGPYRIVWPLPKDVNQDYVSAEFVDGFLRVTLPKL